MKLDKEKIERLYLKGYNYIEIAKVFNWKPESVRKCIQRNFKELKSQHELERDRRKAIDRALKREVNGFMTSRNFVKTNPSIYTQNSKGDLVLKKSEVCYTEDTPRIKRISKNIYRYKRSGIDEESKESNYESKETYKREKVKSE